MAQKPRHQTEDFRQLIWAAIKGAASPVTRAALHHATGIAPSTIANYLKALVAGGVLERLEARDGFGPPPSYRLVRDTGHHAPRLRADGAPVASGNGAANLWRSMRMMGTFSAADLAAHSTTADITVTENHAKVYCSRLLAAGYLRVVQKAAPPTRAAIYRLIRNTGPQPPQLQRVQQVFDPNTGQVYATTRGAP